MRRRDGRQREDLDVVGLQAGDHEARVQAAHAVRDDVHALAIRLGGDVLAELEGALLDRPGRWDGGRDDLHAVCAHGVCDAAPVVDAGEEAAC